MGLRMSTDAKMPNIYNKGNDVLSVVKRCIPTHNTTYYKNNISQNREVMKTSFILAMLAQRCGDIVTSEELLMEIWGDDSYYNLRSLNVFISRIRGYLRDDGRIEIQSVRSMGYRLVVSEEL